MSKTEKYPFSTLEVGQEYVVQCTAEEKRKVRTRLSAYAAMWAKKNGERKFSTHAIDGGIILKRII